MEGSAISLDRWMARRLIEEKVSLVRVPLPFQPTSSGRGWRLSLEGGVEILARNDSEFQAALEGHVPVKTGDRLWVREDSMRLGQRDRAGQVGEWTVVYAADTARGEYALPRGYGMWSCEIRGPDEMARDESRATLLVRGVRVCRVQDLSEDDAELEGMPEPYLGDADPPFIEQSIMVSRTMQSRNHWNRRFGASPVLRHSANPWVMEINFLLLQVNIDLIGDGDLRAASGGSLLNLAPV